MDKVNVPRGVVLLVVTVSVELPDPPTDVGLKAAFAPLGNPAVTAKSTVPAKPLRPEMLTVYSVLPPGFTV